MRQDDAVGYVVAQRFQAKALPQVEAIALIEGGLALLDAWHEADRVYVVDAVQSGAEPGTLHRIEPHHDALPLDLHYRSTHQLNLADSIELARTLEQLPSSRIVYGIEGEQFDFGNTLSERVAEAVDRVIEAILAEIAQF